MDRSDEQIQTAIGEGMPEQAESDNSKGSGTASGETNGAFNPGPVSDPNAPFGLKKDGTPRKSNAGARPKDGTGQPVNVPRETIADTGVAQRERLSRVRQAPASEQPLRNLPIGVDHISLGKDAALLWIGVGQMMFGAEWAPDTTPEGTFTQDGRSEFIALRDGFGNYFKEAGIERIPPGVGLCIVLGAYTVKRAQKPAIKGKLALMGSWCSDKVRGLFRFVLNRR